jgi:ribosomal protein L7/L12
MRNQVIKIKLIEKCANKLIFVKLIKDCSDLGLKESKDICDRLHSHPLETQSFVVRQDGITNYAESTKRRTLG